MQNWPCERGLGWMMGGTVGKAEVIEAEGWPQGRCVEVTFSEENWQFENGARHVVRGGALYPYAMKMRFPLVEYSLEQGDYLLVEGYNCADQDRGVCKRFRINDGPWTKFD